MFDLEGDLVKVKEIIKWVLSLSPLARNNAIWAKNSIVTLKNRIVTLKNSIVTLNRIANVYYIKTEMCNTIDHV